MPITRTKAEPVTVAHLFFKNDVSTIVEVLKDERENSFGITKNTDALSNQIKDFAKNSAAEVEWLCSKGIQLHSVSHSYRQRFTCAYGSNHYYVSSPASQKSSLDANVSSVYLRHPQNLRIVVVRKTLSLGIERNLQANGMKMASISGSDINQRALTRSHYLINSAEADHF